MVQTVTGEYTDDHWDFVEPTDTDMLLRPDASTPLRVVPWAREPTGQIIADCYKPDGEPHPLATRNVLALYAGPLRGGRSASLWWRRRSSFIWSTKIPIPITS